MLSHSQTKKRRKLKETHNKINGGIPRWWFKGAFYFLLVSLLGFLYCPKQQITVFF